MENKTKTIGKWESGGAFLNQTGTPDDSTDQSGVGEFLQNNAPTLLTGVFTLADTALTTSAQEQIAASGSAPKKALTPGSIVPPTAPSSNTGTYIIITIAVVAILGGAYYVIKKKRGKNAA